MLVLLGGMDRRVPPSQGKEYYKTLQCHGVEARFGFFNSFLSIRDYDTVVVCHVIITHIRA